MATIVSEVMSERCRRTFLFLAFLVGSVGSVAYGYYLTWLLYYLTKDVNTLFFAYLLTFLILAPVCAFMTREKELISSSVIWYLLCVVLLEMCLFTMLKRQAYYHLSTDVFIGQNWVIMSLKGSIIFLISCFLVQTECRLKRILKAKEILSRGVLDFIDIFNLVELLSLNDCVGIGSPVTEGSFLEMAIQAFCTLSFLIITHTFVPRDPSTTMDYMSFKKRVKKTFLNIQLFSIFLQNVPFMIIRIIVWERYGIYSLCFMVKNIAFIVLGIAAMIQDRETNYSYVPITRV